MSEQDLTAFEPKPAAEPNAYVEPNAYAERVYTQNATRLRGWLTSICRNETVAEDLAQEAFLRLLREAREGRLPDDPVAWLHRVGANLAMSRGRRLTVAEKRSGELPQPSIVESPEERAVDAEEAAAVRSALGCLDGDDRQAVILAAHGYRGPEIAERLGRTNGATRTLLCRARAKVRQQLLLSGAF
jgi:RNA polymerase sigma-70 factor (ECF subfamily)